MKKNLNTSHNVNRTSLSQSPSNSGLQKNWGGWKLLRAPAAIFSNWVRQTHNKKARNINMRIDSQANDNVMKPFQNHIAYTLKTVCLVIAGIALSGYVGWNYSQMIQGAIEQGNDTVLIQVMAENPEALAFALNNIDVGE